MARTKSNRRLGRPPSPPADEPPLDERPDKSKDDLADGVRIGSSVASIGGPRRLVAEILRMVVVVAGGLAILVFSSQIASLATTGAGLAMAAGGAVVLYPVATASDRSPGTRRLGAASLVLVVGLAALLLAFGPGSLTAAGRLTGVACVLLGVLTKLVTGGGQRRDSPLVGLRPSLLIGGGVVLVLLPGTAPLLAVWVLGVAYLLAGVVRTTVVLGANPPEAESGYGLRAVLRHWVETQERTEYDRSALIEQLFFEPPGRRRKVARYLILMALASVISSVGVISDSTAVVIGAMLVAPLMTPLMATSLALTMGWTNRMTQAALAAFAGVAIAVFVGWVIPLVLPGSVDVLVNTQISSRSSPTLVDLVVAVAAGATGAFALSRPDVSSSLPGVAIAIALVPPLSVVGSTLQSGAFDQARGSLLLFTANAVAILVVGGLVFVLTGVAPLRRMAQNQHRMGTAMISIVALTTVVVGALGLNGAAIARDSLALDDARSVVATWLGPDPEFAVVSVATDGPTVRVVLAGPGEPPSAEDLAARLATRLARAVTLDLQWIPRQQRVIEARP